MLVFSFVKGDGTPDKFGKDKTFLLIKKIVIQTVAVMYRVNFEQCFVRVGELGIFSCYEWFHYKYYSDMS